MLQRSKRQRSALPEFREGHDLLVVFPVDKTDAAFARCSFP
jgi:hypothetical protein